MYGNIPIYTRYADIGDTILQRVDRWRTALLPRKRGRNSRLRYAGLPLVKPTKRRVDSTLKLLSWGPQRVRYRHSFTSVSVRVEITEEENIGIIRFMGYERGERRAGQSVLEKAEDYLKAFNVSRIFAFPQDCRYRFYHFEHAYLSDALDQVQGILGFQWGTVVLKVRSF